jgi:hypothetical protein
MFTCQLIKLLNSCKLGLEKSGVDMPIQLANETLKLVRRLANGQNLVKDIFQ